MHLGEIFFLVQDQYPEMSLQSEFPGEVVTGLPSADGIFIPTSLPCGRSVQNRLVKVSVFVERFVRSSAHLLT